MHTNTFQVLNSLLTCRTYGIIIKSLDYFTLFNQWIVVCLCQYLNCTQDAYEITLEIFLPFQNESVVCDCYQCWICLFTHFSKKKSFILFFVNCSRHLKNYSHKLSTIDLMFQYIEYISRLPLCSFTPKIFCAFVRQTTKIRKIVFIFKFHYSLSVLTF